ncbi:MAG: DUF899 domain-containing protein [Actinobacteria bacterium]|nr:DUF899 domain-containing protein [Actinomycetota bacterium]
MPDRKVVDRHAWIEARLAHLANEKALTTARDQLSTERRNLPWLRVDKAYSFSTNRGRQSLDDLFGDRRQLLIYHFMFGPGWEQGCPSCSFWADNYNGVEAHLADRETALVAVSTAPLAEIAKYQSRMGWSFEWVSSHGSDFNFDMGVSFGDDALGPVMGLTVPSGSQGKYNFGTQEFGGDEAPGVSTFIKDDLDNVFLTYQTFSRGLDMINGAYHMLDLTALGRSEENHNFSMSWLRRHDEY